MATVAARTTDAVVKRCIAIANDVLKLPAEHLWLDYDSDADVLYISFRKPQRSTRTIETDDGVLIRKDGRKIVGLTILSASTR